MTNVYVDFTDDTMTVIGSAFAGPPSTPEEIADHPYAATLDATDPRWHTFYDSFPPWIQAFLVTPG